MELPGSAHEEILCTRSFQTAPMMYQSGKMERYLSIKREAGTDRNKLHGDFIFEAQVAARTSIVRTFPKGDTICCKAVIFSPTFTLGA